MTTTSGAMGADGGTDEAQARMAALIGAAEAVAKRWGIPHGEQAGIYLALASRAMAAAVSTYPPDVAERATAGMAALFADGVAADVADLRIAHLEQA